MHVSTVKDSIVLHLAFERQGGIDWYAFWGEKKKKGKKSEIPMVTVTSDFLFIQYLANII